MSSDDAVRATNDDAASCKRFAVQKGYWSDPYIQYFVRNTERKAPEISIGYYARVKGVKLLLDKFLQLTQCNCQVVNFGAGFDTLYWRLAEEGHVPKSYVEVDFHSVTSKKCHAIKTKKQLLEKIATEDGEIRFNEFDLHAANYHIVAADLRNLDELKSKLHDSNIDFGLPTLFMAECVLVYMELDKSTNLVKWIADSFQTTFFINYEQVNMADRFGQVMIQNLKSRQCLLPGVEVCSSLETQKNRFLSNGWEYCECLEMTAVYQNLPHAEVKRIERLEFLDEKELLTQLFQHYCLCWALKDPKNIGLDAIDCVPT
ncbi:leucine carboxyl methyltransferase 1-like [Lineus longissimus]|uniref:leucine carboxyl methyltransferase 1-like n=1 Tax=Lineus longissimus TaxID=88925 RepID=UPI002B4C6D24